VTIKERFAATKNAPFRSEGEEPPEDFLLLGAGSPSTPTLPTRSSFATTGAWAKDVQADAIGAGGKSRW
jgi:hypothetical protein